VDVAAGPDGTLYIADATAHRVLAVAPDGTSSTLAGDGDPGASGDGGPATDAAIGDPYGVTVSRQGVVYVSDRAHHQVRRVEA
jgi:hypothetical protein